MSHRGKGKPGACGGGGGVGPDKFFALGKLSSTSGSSGGGVKRDGSLGASGSSSSKKAKSGSSLRGSGSDSLSAAAGVTGNFWESVANDSEPPERLAASILNSHRTQDKNGVVSLLCGAVKSLKIQRAKPDPSIYLSLLYVMKKNHEITEYLIVSEHVMEAFCSLLKRDVKESYKAKGNSLVSVLAANILVQSFKDVPHWPEQLVRLYMEDAMSERVWVDHPECKAFVDNILTAFQTKLPTSNQLSFFSGVGSAGKPSTPAENISGASSRDCASPQGSRSGSGSATSHETWN